MSYRNALRAVTRATLCAVLAAGLAGCGGQKSATAPGTPPAAAPREIKIGFFSPLTGGNAAFGTGAKRGIEYAVEQLNAKGGIGGSTVKVITYDDKGDPTEAVQAVTRLVTEDKVVAVIGGSTSTTTLSTAEVTRKYKIPQITPIAGAVDLTRKQNKYILRNVTNNEGIAQKIARYAVKELGHKKLAILLQNDDYGRENAKAFRAEVEALGAQIVGEESFLPKDQSFAGQLGKIAPQKPDAIFLAGYYTEGALIAKQAREMNMQARFLGLNVLSAPQFIEVGGSAVEGTYFAANYHSQAPNATPAMKQFAADWKQKFGQEPNVYEVHGYDTMKILALAIEQAGGAQADEIVARVLALKEYPGASGTTTFLPNGDADKPIVITAIEGGKLVPKLIY